MPTMKMMAMMNYMRPPQSYLPPINPYILPPMYMPFQNGVSYKDFT